MNSGHEAEWVIALFFVVTVLGSIGYVMWQKQKDERSGR